MISFFYTNGRKKIRKEDETLYLLLFKRKRKISILPNMKKLHGEGGEKKLTKVRRNR